MTTTNIVFGLITSCQQRNLQTRFNIPPIRLNSQESPYPKHTKFQLDMRRKAEILKYSSNKQSTQTNNLTKAEKWAKLMSQRSVKNNQQLLDSFNSGYACPKDRMIMTPTSSCDVPGTVMYLFDDETVPLYNYVKNVDSYALLPQSNDTIPYTINGDSNVHFINGDTNTISYIISRTPKDSIYNINITTPMNLQINYPLTNANIYFNLNSIYASVFYAKNLVCTKYLTSNGNSNIDINQIQTFFTSQSSVNSSVILYLGYFSINNLLLNMYPGYAYEIKLTLSYTVTVGNTDITPMSFIICNPG